MPRKNLNYEVQSPFEKCTEQLTRVIDDLSGGKTLVNLFEFNDQFKTSGAWWIQAKDDESGKYQLMWKWFPHKTIYVTVTLAPLTNGNTFVMSESKMFTLFDLFNILDIPLKIFKDSINAKITSGI